MTPLGRLRVILNSSNNDFCLQCTNDTSKLLEIYQDTFVQVLQRNFQSAYKIN